MEIIKIKKNDGDEVCYIRCEVHNWFADNKPPLVSGCTSCWMAYYFAQRALMKPELMDMGLEELETAIHHMQEEIEKGGWDLKLLDHPIVEINREEN